LVIGDRGDPRLRLAADQRREPLPHFDNFFLPLVRAHQRVDADERLDRVLVRIQFQVAVRFHVHEFAVLRQQSVTTAAETLAFEVHCNEVKTGTVNFGPGQSTTRGFLTTVNGRVGRA